MLSSVRSEHSFQSELPIPEFVAARGPLVAAFALTAVLVTRMKKTARRDAWGHTH